MPPHPESTTCPVRRQRMQLLPMNCYVDGADLLHGLVGPGLGCARLLVARIRVLHSCAFASPSRPRHVVSLHGQAIDVLQGPPGVHLLVLP